MQVTLTEREKCSPSYLDWDDASLGRLVKATALVIGDDKGTETIQSVAAACLLVKKSIDAESLDVKWSLFNVTIPEPVGNWVVTVEKMESEE